MNTPQSMLTIVGALLLLGLLAHVAGKRTAVPRVTLLLLLGIAIGPSGFNVLPDPAQSWFTTVADMALVMVGFLLGSRMTWAHVRGLGRSVLTVSIGIVVATFFAVFAGLLLAGFDWPLALMLAAVAPATDPAATADVIAESGAKGKLTDLLIAVVAIDDAWGLIMFSLALSAADVFNGDGGGAALLNGAWELGGAVGLGILIGLPMAALTGRIEPGEPTAVEALGGVFLCGGAALWLEVSFLLSAMTLGVVIANRARHHTRPFHAIEGFEAPFLVLFFLLAGASLDLSTLPHLGVIGGVYVGCRVIGRLVGAAAGNAAAGDGPSSATWTGLALLPQAGVALGMALLAVQRFPELHDSILPVVIAATVVFEIAGPILTRTALKRAGEAGIRMRP